MNNVKKKLQKGFSIIESLVAISIVTLAITSATSVVQNSIQNVQITKARTQAIFFATEAIEFARNLRDANIVSGSANKFDGGFKSFFDECSKANKGCFLDVLSNTYKYERCLNKNDDECGDIYLAGNKYTADNADSPTPFNRKVYLEGFQGGDEVAITVDVTFTIRDFTETLTLTSYLMNHE